VPKGDDRFERSPAAWHRSAIPALQRALVAGSSLQEVCAALQQEDRLRTFEPSSKSFASLRTSIRLKTWRVLAKKTSYASLDEGDSASYLTFSRMAKRSLRKIPNNPNSSSTLQPSQRRTRSSDAVSSKASPAPAPTATGEDLTVTAEPLRKKGAKVQDDEAPLAQSYRNWFLEYASYVILDRAVPHIDDGLKPVAAPHSAHAVGNGGRTFHKVANVVGATMRFHPHGDVRSARHWSAWGSARSSSSRRAISAIC